MLRKRYSHALFDDSDYTTSVTITDHLLESREFEGRTVYLTRKG